ncbi:MAG: FecR domain-containing protein [Oligoflexia bacterium]|nr:FecR domain-containing protein [Oligoflexia bacterium]
MKLLFNDKSIVEIGPSSLFHVDGFKGNQGGDREVDVTMLYGSVRTAVTKPLTGKGKFRVKTPTATMGVRGTEFVVRSDFSSMKEIAHGVQNAGKPLAAPVMPMASAKGLEQAAANIPAPKMEVIVLQGKVAVETPALRAPGERPRGGQMLNLTAGQGLTADAKLGPAMAAVNLKPEQMKAAGQVARVADTTFKKAIVIDASTNLSGSASKSSSGNSSSAQGQKSERAPASAAATEGSTETSAEAPASGAEAPTAAGSTETAEAEPAAMTTAEIVTNVVTESVAPVLSTAPSQPVADVASFIPVTQTTAPVTIPAGGLKRVTIKVTR